MLPGTTNAFGEFAQQVAGFTDVCVSIVDSHRRWTAAGRPQVLCDWALFEQLSDEVEVVRGFTMSLARAVMANPPRDPEFADLCVKVAELGFTTLAIADDMEFLPPMMPVISEVLSAERCERAKVGLPAPPELDRSLAYSQGRAGADSIPVSDLVRAAIGLFGVVTLLTNTAPLPVSLGMLLVGPEAEV